MKSLRFDYAKTIKSAIRNLWASPDGALKSHWSCSRDSPPASCAGLPDRRRFSEDFLRGYKCKGRDPFGHGMLGDEGGPKSAPDTCTVPQPKADPVGDDRWLSMHRRYLAETKSSEAEVLLVGDSIIQQLQFTSLWNEKFNSLHCLNFGIGGDRVEHVLWRMLNGELDFSPPIPIKAVALFVGTNNTDCTAQSVFDGICEIIKVIKEKLGDVFIIVPTLLPRGQHPNPNRERNRQVNALLLGTFGADAASADDSLRKNVYVVSIHDDIIQGDQTISHHVMYDYLHLTNQGYQKTFQPVYNKLQQLLHDKAPNQS